MSEDQDDYGTVHNRVKVPDHPEFDGFLRAFPERTREVLGYKIGDRVYSPDDVAVIVNERT